MILLFKQFFLKIDKAGLGNDLKAGLRQKHFDGENSTRLHSSKKSLKGFWSKNNEPSVLKQKKVNLIRNYPGSFLLKKVWKTP